MSARSAGLVLCASLSLSGCGYSSLQQQDEDVKASWSEVVSLYQRRADLISGLAATLKGFADPCARIAHSDSDQGAASRPHPCDARVAPSEQELIGATQANARTGSMPAAPGVLTDPAAFASYQALQKQLTQSLRSLMGVSASYPQLQSDANFQDLQTQLTETESSITAARDHYMAAVRNFNSMVQTFPTDVTARVFDFRPRPNLAAAVEK
ncbi:MAG TPA: LemA family protein [Steroidobacteraceae bacterium]|nr:LemA family protein [Steroidobacteraceae bacterium]